MSYDVVFERSKSEKNEATPTPSRAHVIGGGGEGVCAFTGEVLWPCRPQGADYGGSNEIGKKRRVFFVVVEEAEGFRDEAGGASENCMKSLAFHGILPEIGSFFFFFTLILNFD